ncbi:MAG: hypothetical protein LBV30_07910 [Propionibacteriaceae bacterium]|nr:hypothetical protein [Propionibacteriaceae bacterium]
MFAQHRDHGTITSYPDGTGPMVACKLPKAGLMLGWYQRCAQVTKADKAADRTTKAGLLLVAFARVLASSHPFFLRANLIALAGRCVQWVEIIDRQTARQAKK